MARYCAQKTRPAAVQTWGLRAAIPLRVSIAVPMALVATPLNIAVRHEFMAHTPAVEADSSSYEEERGFEYRSNHQFQM